MMQYVRTPPSFPRALLSLASFCPRCEVFFKAPEHFFPMRGALLRGASHEPKDVFSRALFSHASGALVSEGVLHVGAMGVALCRAGGNPVLAPCLGDVDDQVKPTQPNVHDHPRAITS